MSTSANRSPKAAVQLVTNADQPAAVQAVSLALGVLRHAGVATWAELIDHFPHIPDGLVLSEDQIRLLAEWQDLFPFIAWGLKGPGGQGAATVTVAVCPECGRWEQVAGPASSRCRLKLLCPGMPVKAAVAQKTEVPGLSAEPKMFPRQPELLDAEPCNTPSDVSVDPSDIEF
jgi:hypothetical protein